MVLKLTLILAFINVLISGYTQTELFGMAQLTDEQLVMKAPFCLKNSAETKDKLIRQGVEIQYQTSNWIFITSTASEIQKLFENEVINDFYLEYNPPYLLNDSARATHLVDQVHDGIGLSSPYKGKDVIIGYVDTGVDFNHPDFKNSDGSTRILRYWDHSTNVGGTLSPYGFGIVWDSTQINAGLCTSTDGNAHGTTVTGAGSGNGASTGYNQGTAPESDIIIVEAKMNMPNFTMSIANACDYIFKVADSLGKPAVVNISLGTYFGSHDGNDPASEYIENLLEEKEGRIVVSACGNSANIGKYHCNAQIDADTSFVWFLNNPSGSLGPNRVFFDLYSDYEDATFEYAFKAIRPANFSTRGEIEFRNATFDMGNVVYDTIWNGTNRIATVEVYRSQEGENYHFQGLLKVDSTSYYYGFYTTGSGNYDLWSGQGLGFNNMVTNIPLPGVYPPIIHYNAPDSLQTIVSSWNCSEKVISVGNIKNRSSFPNLAGGTYFPSDAIPVGKLSINSSKGPNRHNVLKPDIAASGDVMLSPAPLWYLANAANHTRVDTGAWHMTNGGTSMSSPVVAGIAALFLERCANATYQDFKDAIGITAMPNAYTGSLPNYAYGNGLINAHELLLLNEFEASIAGSPYEFCSDPIELSITGTQSIENASWSDGEEGSTNYVSVSGEFSAIAYNEYGCGVLTDTVSVIQLEVPTIDPITVNEDFSELSTTSSSNYQWTLNGVDLVDEDTPTLAISEPFGTYTCYAVSADGCITETDPFTLTLGNLALEIADFFVYPNPTLEKIRINEDLIYSKIQLFDMNGREQKMMKLSQNEYDISGLAVGAYFLKIETIQGIKQTKIIRR